MFLFDGLYLVFLLLSLPLWLKFILKKEYSGLLKSRLSPMVKGSVKKRIWIHAVSVGEVKSLKNLISQLRSTYGKEIVLSVTTPTGYRFAREHYPDLAVIGAPLDFSFVIRRFIRSIHPELLILNELELWPNWILVSKKLSVPIVLINGRISEAAFRRYQRFLFILRRFFKHIDFYMVQSDIFRRRFARFGIPAERIVVCGNVKADEAVEALAGCPSEPEIKKHLKINAGKKPILTVASSHAQDERFVVQALRMRNDLFATIIVPRHIDRVPDIRKLCGQKGLPCVVWSQAKEINPDQEILIFDRMGYLFNILKISQIVFMGGTLEHRIGGHNLYEPAVLGKAIVGGPYYNNFPAIGEDLVARGVYRVVRHPGEMISYISTLQAQMLEIIGDRAEEAVMNKKGSIECILNQIQRLIRL